MSRYWKAVLAALLLLASCGGAADAESSWCEAYQEWNESLIAHDAASNAAERSDAVNRVQAAGEILLELGPPEVIAVDYEIATSPPTPETRDEEWVAAAGRVVDWAIENCGYSPEFNEILQSG